MRYFTCSIDEFKYLSSPSMNSLILLLCKRMFDSSFLTALLGSSHSTPPEVMSIPNRGLQVNHLVSMKLSFRIVSCSCSHSNSTKLNQGCCHVDCN